MSKKDRLMFPVPAWFLTVMVKCKLFEFVPSMWAGKYITGRNRRNAEAITVEGVVVVANA